MGWIVSANTDAGTACGIRQAAVIPKAHPPSSPASTGDPWPLDSRCHGNDDVFVTPRRLRLTPPVIPGPTNGMDAPT